jgi:hypothetical protein
MFEVWQHVPGFGGMYEISNLGRVWSNRSNKLMSLSIANTGYYQVNLAGKICHPHCLVLEAFVGPRPYKYDACHANGCKTDNRLENLRWDTRAGNMADAIKHGKTNRGERSPFAKLTESDVRQIRELPNTQAEIARKFNISREHVRDIRLGKRWAHLQ